MAYFEDELARLDAKVQAYKKLQVGFEAELERLRPEQRRLSWLALEGNANAGIELKQVESRIEELRADIARIPMALEQLAIMREAWLKRQPEFEAAQVEFETLRLERPTLLRRIDSLTSELEKAVEKYLAHSAKLATAADRVRNPKAVSFRKSGDRLFIYLSWKLLRFDNRIDRTAVSGFFRRNPLAQIEAWTLAPEAPAPEKPAAEFVLA